MISTKVSSLSSCRDWCEAEPEGTQSPPSPFVTVAIGSIVLRESMVGDEAERATKN